MTAAKKFSDGVLKKLPAQKLHVLVGEITTLLMASKVHRQYQIRDIADVIFPAINLGQYKIFRNASRQPIGLVTWGRFSPEVEKKYLKGNPVLSEKELTSGDRLYFLDFVAPYGHAKQVTSHLRKHVFPNDLGTSVRFTGNVKSPMKILKFYGVNYKKRLN
jgi:cytolysin-activating lysine-acyltransferase